MTIGFPQISGYQIQRLLGQGGMASVFLAVQEKLNRPVAVKVLSPILLGDKKLAARFMNEAEMAAGLNHPHIVPIFDVGREHHWVYIVMEFLHSTLRDKVRSNEVNSIFALNIVRQMAEALDYAHRKGIVHRDIKPENIMFREIGTAVLVDFGIARAMGTASRLTQEGMSIGTPLYMSPEQARGLELDGRCDIYSLGVVLYEMLTGQLPFDGQDAVTIISKHLQEPIPRLPLHLQHLQPLLDRMLAKDRNTRFGTAGELLNQIKTLRLLGMELDDDIDEGHKQGAFLKSENTPIETRGPEFFGGYPCEVKSRSGPMTAVFSAAGSLARKTRSNIPVVLLGCLLIVTLGLLFILTKTDISSVPNSLDVSFNPVIKNRIEPRKENDILPPRTPSRVISSFEEEKGGIKSDGSDHSKVSEDSVLKTVPGKAESVQMLSQDEIDIDLVWIPPGTFLRGSENGDPDERPVRRVSITKGFWMGRTEVTQGQWKAVTGENLAIFPLGDDYPIENVSWEDGKKFIRVLNFKTGKKFRLPTEAEWEYASRTGTTGESIMVINHAAWYSGNSGGSTQPVGLKNRNAFGLHDMLGNVREWVEDLYSSEYYDRSPKADPPGPMTGSGRVVRGGSWADDGSFIRPASRGRALQTERSSQIGLRLVLDE